MALCNQSASTAIVWRIIGNDIPPMQSHDQSRRNLAFILAHEPEPPPGIQRRWLLNRIVDRTEAALLRQILETHGHVPVELPFEDAEAQHLLRGDSPPSPTSIECDPPSTKSKASAIDDPAGDPLLLYATNQNGARNHILRLSQVAGVSWCFPLDGQLFFTAEAWAAMGSALRASAVGGHNLMKMAMVRLPQAQGQWLHAGSCLEVNTFKITCACVMRFEEIA
jgi:hypothetical protein